MLRVVLRIVIRRFRDVIGRTLGSRGIGVSWGSFKSRSHKSSVQ
jgi:hypothetical protein